MSPGCTSTMYDLYLPPDKKRPMKAWQIVIGSKFMYSTIHVYSGQKVFSELESM